MTPKTLALVIGLLTCSQALAQSCPDIQIKQAPWTGTPLHEAIHANDVDRARRLIGTSTIDVRDSFGNTPLVYALTPAEALEPAGIVSAARTRALVAAENKARQAIASALIAKGADVNMTGARGVTPLMKLAAAGYAPGAEIRLARQLLNAGANLNARDDFGSTALLVAARHRKSELVELLLSKGADPTAANCRGETAASFLGSKK
jgi:ankyrin repeat protein